MKKHLLLFAMMLMGMTLMANPVDPDKAMQVAKNFVMTQVKMDGYNATIVYTHLMPQTGEPAFYAVNVGSSAFVLVAADDIAHPVLGYSMSRSWPTGSADGSSASPRGEQIVLPSQVTAFLDDFASQIEAAHQQGIESDSETIAEWQQLLTSNTSLLTTTNLPDSVGPLLTTTWDQGQYYNALCPEDANGPAGHTYTGCVATAMAQIINYWGYPVHGRGTHSYETNYGTLTVNYDSVNYDYTHMTNALTSTSTPQEVQAVATLMRDCGVAANMDYSPNESGSLDIDARAGMINYFRLNPGISYAEKNYFSNAEWKNMLCADIANGRPVFYGGQGTGGHAFVCDGYKQNGYFHFNFGWSGYADGWYLTSAVNPAGMAFNSVQSALLGIFPDSTGNVILGQMAGTSTFIVDNPLEFYHLLGHNTYTGTSYNNACNNTVNFISANATNQLVVDIIEFENQNITINDGNGAWLRSLTGGSENSMSPVVSYSNALSINYSGNFYYAGFQLAISQDEGCRRVSNIITSVDTTTVHLMWTENGTATQWQIEYGEEGFTHGNGTTMLVNNTLTDITFPQRLTKYDIYIRSVCENNNYDSWTKISIKTEAPYWQDLIVSQPSSYTIDYGNNCVLISCAEDFVWYTKDPMGRNAMFISDIDLSGYKWRPISWFGNKIDGKGHVITSLYINEEYDYAGLISHLRGTICDLGIVNSFICGGHTHTAGFCGELGDNPGPAARIINCFISNSEIHGGDFVSGIASSFLTGSINNCYANVKIFSRGFIGAKAGFITAYSEDTISNCYAAGTIYQQFPDYCGGISAYSVSGFINDCYSIDLPRGSVVGYKGTAEIFDTSSFYFNDNTWTLHSPVEFDGNMEDNLLDALNKGVVQRNDSTLRIWIADTGNNGLPKFGDFYIVQCKNVANLTIRNTKRDTISCVIVDWDEIGNSDSWEIKYKPVGFSDDSAVLINVASKPDTLYNIPLGQEYLFSVRSLCDDTNHSGWASKKEFVDLPFWTDIVTEQPNGYVEDSIGNVTISSPEGLAWLSVLVNGFHGNERQNFSGKNISLANDINLEGYRWYPIGRDYETPFKGRFLGNGHSIFNLYINCSGIGLGLFGAARDEAVFENIKLSSGIIISSDNSSYIGGLLGSGYRLQSINDCSSNIIVKGIGTIGALCGYIDDDDGEATVISNCYATGDVYGRESTGGLIGEVRGSVVQNCYATGNVYLIDGSSNAWYRGGLIGNFMSNAVVRNCYSTGTVEIDDNCSYYGRVIGCPYMNSTTHYVYGLNNSNLPLIGPSSSADEIADTSSFINSNGQQILQSPITINGTTYDCLLDALNAWVSLSNDPLLKVWTIDTNNENGGYPVLGNNYEPSCYNPTNVIAENATMIGDTIISTRIQWEQQGDPISWEILYVHAQQSIDSGTIISVNSNPCILTDMPIGALLDIYVRAVCDSNEKSGWSESVKFIPDKLHWTEVVTSQPDGYQEDQYSNVYISSAEGLSWLASRKNKLNGNTEDFYPQSVTLMSDIDLSAYRWTAINNMACIFEGNNHIIRGLYCNENENYQGLFSEVFPGCTIQNVILLESSVHGLNYNGIISGYTWGSITNCIVNGEIFGLQYTGGLCGISYGSVINSAFVGELNARSDVSLPNYINGFYGGIVGNTAPGCQIINTYVVSEIPEYGFSGIIAGSGQGEYRNIFALYYPTGLNLTYDNTESNSSFFTGSGSVWTLSNPLFIGGVFHSNLIDALNAWVDANDTAGVYRHWAADSANVNGGFPVFAAIPCPVINVHDTVAACESYTWNGDVYTVSVVVTDTLSTMNGCDSIVTLHLTINNPVHTATTETACESYTWNNTTYITGGNYTFFLLDANGCTQVDTLHLTINSPVHTSTTEIACETYTWNGTTYTVSGNYTYSHTDANGCTQVDTLHLTINLPVATEVSDTACESYTWFGTTYTATGDYVRTGTSAYPGGCDTTETLHLTINNPVHIATTQAACESYTWNNTAYTTSGDYTFSHLDANGCTQVDTLQLTINFPVVIEVYDAACDSYTWYGTTYTATGDYVRTGPSAFPGGCDTTETLHLTINNPVHTATTQAACETYSWNNTNYTASGNYTYSHLDANGCTQVDTLHLTINLPVVSEVYDTACESYTWYGTTYTATGDYVRTGPSAFPGGCDTTETLHLTINNPVHTAIAETACESYSWNNTNYIASGNYIYSHFDANGCTQVDTLHLTINIPVHTATTQVACESYTWNNTAYTTSGNYTFSHLDANGCTQVDTLHLTINTPIITDAYDTACDNYTWFGTTYTATGDYMRTGTSAYPGGCDTTETLHLTINHSVTLFDTLSLLSNELPYNYHGNTINAEGDYTFTSTTTEGCDSTVYLYVTVTPVSIFEIQNSEFEITIFPNPTNGVVTIACDKVTWVEVMDVSGRKVQTVENSNRIDLSKLPSGVYTLQITTPRGKALKRVIRK